MKLASCQQLIGFGQPFVLHVFHILARALPMKTLLITHQKSLTTTTVSKMPHPKVCRNSESNVNSRGWSVNYQQNCLCCGEPEARYAHSLRLVILFLIENFLTMGLKSVSESLSNRRWLDLTWPIILIKWPIPQRPRYNTTTCAKVASYPPRISAFRDQ